MICMDHQRMNRGQLLTDSDSLQVEMIELITPTNSARRDRSSDDDVHDTLVEAQSAARRHPGVLSDGWLAYFKRAVPHFFVGEPGDRPWLNFLMAFFFLAMIADSKNFGNGVTFTFSLLAIVPFAERLGFVTEQLAIHTNETLGGLLNATFGNATEVIVAIFAIRKGFLRLVQVSLLGSVLSNLLLVLGCSFFFGGLKHSMQYFKKTSSSVNSGLLLLAVMSILFPAVIVSANVERNHGFSQLALSRFIAVFLLLSYGAYLYYQLKSHSHLYEDKQDEAERGGNPIPHGDTPARVRSEGDGDDEDDVPILGFWGSIVALTLVTVVISVLSDYLVKAIEGASESWNVSNVFIGVIVIPIAGNAAEHASAVIFAMKNRMEIAIGIALGSSIQIALFVMPLMVVIGWGMGQPLSLNFHEFEAATLFAAVVIVSILIQKGQSTWLSGWMLVIAYLIIAAAFFVHKSDPESVIE